MRTEIVWCVTDYINGRKEVAAEKGVAEDARNPGFHRWLNCMRCGTVAGFFAGSVKHVDCDYFLHP